MKKEKPRMKKKYLLPLAFVALAASGSASLAQGIPVVDKTAILKQIEQISTLTKQLENARQQLGQLQELHGSLNKLTDMGDVAKLLNDPSIRRALPKDFSQLEGLLKGNAGQYGDSYNRHLEENTIYKTQDANDFYAQELERVRKKNAGQMTVGEQMYQAASKRIDGIDELKDKIGKSKDAKETLDLQARLQAESAYLQTDVLRMQALQTVQQAQVQVDAQRAAENKRKFSEDLDGLLK